MPEKKQAIRKNTPLWKLKAVRKGAKLFENASELWEAACDYFKYIDDNPHVDVEIVKYQGDCKLIEVPRMKPYTLSGLCFFLGCSESYFRVMKFRIRERQASTTPKDSDAPFLEVIEAIEQVIETQQLEGAVVGVFNYNVVRAKLGLVDKQDLTSNGQTIFRINVQKDDDLRNLDSLE